MKQPLFSIVLTTFNRADRIGQTISYVLQQTFQDFELIVVDDGSTDNTREIVEKIRDERVSYYYKENEERSIGRNFGLEKATGKYISYHDSDDILYGNHLQVAAEAIERLKNPEVFHLDYEFRDASGKASARKKQLPALLDQHLLKNSEVAVLGVFIRSDVAHEFKFIHHRSAVLAEDLFVWLRIASRYDFHHVPQVTSALGLHSGRSVHDRNPFKFLKSTLLIINNLSRDSAFIEHYSKKKANFFFAKSLVQVALVYAENKKNSWALKLVAKSTTYSPVIFFNRTFLATLRCVFTNVLK